MIISIVFDGTGYLIVNREYVSEDISDFECLLTEEFQCYFCVFNEPDECFLLKRFFSLIQKLRPAIFVTFNGDVFDWPYISRRSQLSGIDMFASVGVEEGGFYSSCCSSHVDVYKWVKRDSYLPVGSQGLKKVTEIKLGFVPMEIDYEKTVEYAQTRPFLLASYAVSDALSTYHLYLKHVSPFLFSMCTIIPYNIDCVLRKGTGTLCEALLMAEAHRKNILIPNKTGSLSEKFYQNHLVNSETYVGGHVETLEVGLFRSDIPVKFCIDKEYIGSLAETLDDLFAYIAETEGLCSGDIENSREEKDRMEKELAAFCEREHNETPRIMHFDIAAMYPNIILTNRLQPFAIAKPETCAACDFNAVDAPCKRVLEWTWKVETFSSTKKEFENIEDTINKENKETQIGNREKKRLVHSRFEKYNEKMYRKTKNKENITKKETVCMRENSFYIDTVRSFRDKRYHYKNLQKKWSKEEASEERTQMLVLYDSLQLAHKCILNSFYGYVMRKGARWYSIEMAGIVCKTGSDIIKSARRILEKIGRPIELDTDGIWTMVPSSFPDTLRLRTTTGKMLSGSCIFHLLNYNLAKEFSNQQYYAEGRFRLENSLVFEADGPYHAMFIPCSTEEGRLLKKRYLVFSLAGQMVETKGFEIKRRGELKIVKEMQRELFSHFLYGKTLKECYGMLSSVARRWLEALFTKGRDKSAEEISELLVEEKNMSRSLVSYGKQKSCAITTANRLRELFPQLSLEKGITCRYLITKEPRNLSVAQRAIPVEVFQHPEETCNFFIEKWTKQRKTFSLKDVIDWDYYIDRTSSLVQKLVLLPAVKQGLHNPMREIKLPKWIEEPAKTEKKLTHYFSTDKSAEKKEYAPLQTSRKEISLLLKIEQKSGTEFLLWSCKDGEVHLMVRNIDQNFYAKEKTANSRKTFWKYQQETIVLYETANTFSDRTFPNIATLDNAVNRMCAFDRDTEIPAKLNTENVFVFLYRDKQRIFCAVFQEKMRSSHVHVLSSVKQLKSTRIAGWNVYKEYHSKEKTLFAAVDSLFSSQTIQLVVLQTNMEEDAVKRQLGKLSKHLLLAYPSRTLFPGLDWQQTLFDRAQTAHRKSILYTEELLVFSNELQVPMCNVSADRLSYAFRILLQRELLRKNILVHPQKNGIPCIEKRCIDTKGCYDGMCLEIELENFVMNAVLCHVDIKRESKQDCQDSILFDVVKKIVSSLSRTSLSSSCFDSLLEVMLEESLLDRDVKKEILLLLWQSLSLLVQYIEQTTAKVFFASYSRLLITTSKKEHAHAEALFQYLVAHLLQKPFFQNIAFSSVRYWKKSTLDRSEQLCICL